MTSEGASLGSVRTKVSTGYSRLDEALHGGFVAGSMVVLNAPAGDEAPIILRNFLKSEQPSLLICRNLSSAQVIVPDAAGGTMCLICSDKPVSAAKGILPGKGIENLTDLNLQINEALTSIQPKRLALDILSDVLLRHKALQTRKWLNELLERLRARGITTLAIINPHMHGPEESQAIVDLFDGNLEVLEKDVGGTLRRFLRIKWMHGIEVGEKELPLIDLTADAQVLSQRARPTFDKLRVAVLPLKNMSPDPNDEYFADGMTEELLTSLSGVRQLNVIARTSVMGYKGTTKKVREIGRELEVGSVLEGSVRKAGNKVRITAQLIDVSTESHLWAQNYDRQLDDVFAIQSEIAEKVAGELKIRLVDSEKKALEKKPTENTEAYTYFLKGRELFRQDTEGSLKQGLNLFEKAIELDPKFAKAYVGVADCHLFLGTGGYETFDVCTSAAKAALDHALTLEPDLPEAHASLAYLNYSEDNLPGTEVEARRALELNPNLPEPYGYLSELAATQGDLAEAVRLNEAGYRLDPIRPLNVQRLAAEYVWAGREQDALELLKKTEQLAPAFTYRGMTEYYLIKGDVEKAGEFYARVEKLEPKNPRILWMGGYIAALKGDRETALLTIKRIEDLKGGEVRFNLIAYVYYALGDLDSFFEYMNKAMEAHVVIPSPLMHSPLLAKARADPRYVELLEKLRKQTGLMK